MKKEFEAIREIDGVKFYSEGYLLSREIIAKDDERKQYEQKIKELEKEIEQWKMQFSQAEMIINDIKRITKCKSDDGVIIVESVEQLKNQLEEKDSLRLRIKERIEELETKIDELRTAYHSGGYDEETKNAMSRDESKAEAIIEELKSLLGSEKEKVNSKISISPYMELINSKIPKEIKRRLDEG